MSIGRRLSPEPERGKVMKKLMPAMLVVALALSGCGRSGHSNAALKALDPDNDGTVSLSEAQAGATKIFAKLNSDNDGTLDAKELSGRLDATGIKAADPDNDGTLDAKEYAAIVAEKFKAADPDNDGTLDKKELKSPAGQELLKLIYE
jgi:Ca2+-binding EF-hand superfamily protein